MRYPKKTPEEKQKSIMLIARCKREGFTPDQLFWVELTTKKYSHKHAEYIAQKRFNDEVMQGIYEAFDENLSIELIDRLNFHLYSHSHIIYLIAGIKDGWSEEKIALLTDKNLDQNQLAHLEASLNTCPIEFVKMFARKEICAENIVKLRKFVENSIDSGMSADEIEQEIKQRISIFVLEY